MKSSKKQQRPNLILAFYFGLGVLLIIVISITFKTIDIVRSSRFDGENRFTVAILDNKDIDLISVSPSEGTLTKLHVTGVSGREGVKTLLVPINAYVELDSDFSVQSKNIFSKLLFSRDQRNSDLTIFDLIRLSFYSLGVSGENVAEEDIAVEDSELSRLTVSLFVDPLIVNEKVSIQVTNATEVGGLGNRVAKYLTNLGANVVLVNSSKDMSSKSQIYYDNESYTSSKVMKHFKIMGVQKDSSPLSDIVIVIGEDRKDF